jgi:hypothetical protein
VPAAAIAKYYSGRSLEVAVALGIAVGTLALIVADAGRRSSRSPPGLAAWGFYILVTGSAST